MGKGAIAMGTTAAVLALAGCGLQTGRPAETAASADKEGPSAFAVDAPSNNPPERDDASAPVVKTEIHGKAPNQVVVPSFYGYPLYAEGAALQGVRLLRQDNWSGYDRQEQTQPDGVVRVFETFPVLGCTFEGIEEDDAHYVPLTLTCDVPAPRDRGSERPVAGAIAAGAKAETVPKDPALAKAFFGEWHALSDGFGDNGNAYFDTPSGLLGFGFQGGRLASVSYVFDTQEQRWRTPDLWKAPLQYEVGR